MIPMLTFRDASGIVLEEIRDYIKVDYARKENDVGVLELWLPPVYPLSMFAVDQRLEPWRNTGGGWYLDGESPFFLRNWRYSSEGRQRSIYLKAYDANYLYDGWIIAYNSANAYSEKVDYCDDMMKAIIRENMGSLATDIDRTIETWLQVEADLSQAAQSHKAFAHRYVLSVLQELAQESRQRGTYLSFDTVYVSESAMKFRTYTGARGDDHSGDSKDPVIINEDSRTLAEVVLDEDHSQERNTIYAGGQGVADARAIYKIQDQARALASPFNRREFWLDARNSSDADQLESEARAALEAGRAKQVLTGQILETPGLRYGVHYRFGDILVAEAQGYSFDAHVEAIHVTADRDHGEVLDNHVRGEA